MNSIIAAIKSEPVMILVFIQALIALGTSFGLHLSAEQEGGILTVTQLGLGLITRQIVTPNASLPIPPK